MIVSRRWLEALLGRALEAEETARLLTMRCAAVDAVIGIHQDLGGVLVARVTEVRRHPNADRLSLCVVDAGSARGSALEVVCGAPNVAAGRLYPFAPVGASLPGIGTLERRKIRGVESNGMLCSAKDLGLGDDHAGILELDTTAAPGTRLLDAVPLEDHQIVIDVGANRPDLLCHKGVARELAAALAGGTGGTGGTGTTVKLPEIPGGSDNGTAARSSRPTTRQSDGVVDGVQVRLEDPEGAPRYMIAVIRGVRVGKSPRWLADRLASIGQRSINNIVDATNYILFEINQPLHAFDLAKLRGPAVVVRRARPGEKIVTLDGVERSLTADMTAICDAERPTIIAGVMGSAESEVSDRTTDLVLECAYFQPTRIRRTRRAVGLDSPSSYRFERGIDMLGMPDALRRAVDLICAVAGGTMREPPVDLWPEPVQARSVFLRPERVTQLLGIPVERSEIERHLSSVGFVAAPKDGRMAVHVPGWRPDVTAEVDLVEEVARLKGYDAFPDELRPYRPGTVPDARLERVKDYLRRALAAAGMLEARTMPLGGPDGPEAIAITNPLSAEDTHLPSRLLPGLTKRVEHNWSRRTRDIRLFEIATVFTRETGNGKRETSFVAEEIHVAGVVTGARSPLHWTAKVPDIDLWDLKYHFELAVTAAAPSCNVQPATAGAGVGWEAVQSGTGEVRGRAGPLRADAPVWAAPLFGFEIVVESAARPVPVYRPLPQTPSVERDIALVLPPGVTAASVEAVLRRVSREAVVEGDGRGRAEGGEGGAGGAGGGAPVEILERLVVFDEYRGPGLAPGERSVAWHCSFRDPTRTLREAEVDRVLTAALKALEGELGVRRRES
jgi:phenylalanyl-tRNA synthetase beta chain